MRHVSQSETTQELKFAKRKPCCFCFSGQNRGSVTKRPREIYTTTGNATLNSSLITGVAEKTSGRIQKWPNRRSAAAAVIGAHIMYIHAILS